MKLNITTLLITIAFLLICQQARAKDIDLRLEPQIKTGASVMTYSPDKKKLFIVSPDGTLQVIDTATGSILRNIITRKSLPPGNLIPNPVCFTIDGSKAAIVTINPTEITIYDINTGTKIGNLVIKQPVRGISFTRDGSGLVVVSENIVAMYTIADGKQMWLINSGGGQLSLVMIHQQRQANEISLIKNNIIRIEWKLADKSVADKYGKDNERVGVSTDGKMIIALTTSQPVKYRIWENNGDMEARYEGSSLSTPPNTDGKFYIHSRTWTKMTVDELTGKSINTYTRNFASCISACQSVSGDTIAVCESYDNTPVPRKLIVVKRTENGYNKKDITPLSGTIQISPDGKYIVNTVGTTVIVINSDTGEIVKKITPVNGNSATFSPDSKEIAILSFNPNVDPKYVNPLAITRIDLLNDVTTTLKTGDTAKARYCTADIDRSCLFISNIENKTSIWNMKTGKFIQIIKPDINMSIDPKPIDNSIDIFENNLNKNDLWNVVENKKTINQQETFSKGILSPDCNYKFTVTDDLKSLYTKDIAGWKELFKPDNTYGSSPALFSPDSKLLLLPDINKKYLHLIDIVSNKNIKKYIIPEDFGDIANTAFSPDGLYITAINTNKQIAIIWKSDSPDEYYRVTNNDKAMLSINFTADSKQLLVTGTDGFVISCDINKKTSISHFTGLFGSTTGIYHFPQQKIIAIVYSCGLIRLYRENSWELAGTLLEDKDGKWMIYDPQNHFETPDPDIFNSLCGVIDDTVVSIKQLRKHYFTTDLYKKIIEKTANPDAGAKEITNILPPGAEVILPEGQNTVLTIRLNNRGGGIGTTRVILNGSNLTNVIRKDNIDNTKQEVTDTVNLADNGAYLPDEVNSIEIITSMADDSMQIKGEPLYWHAPMLTTEKIVTLMPQSCHSKSITDIEYNYNGTKALSTDTDGKIILWDVVTGDKQAEFTRDVTFNYRFSNAIFTPDGSMVVTVSGENIVMWDIKSCKIVRKSKIPQTRIPMANFNQPRYTLSFNHDGRYLALSGDTSGCKIFDMKNFQPIRDQPNLKMLMDAGNTQYIEIYSNTLNLCQYKDFMTPAPPEYTCDIPGMINAYYSLSADFTKIATFSVGQLMVYETHTGNVIAALQFPPANEGRGISQTNNRISPVSINALGDRCAALNNLCGPSIILWDIYKKTKIAEYTLSEDTSSRHFCEFSRDGKRLVIWLDNGNAISMADAESGKVLWNITDTPNSSTLPGNGITSMRITPDSKSVLIGYGNGAIEKRDIETGVKLCDFGYRTVNFDMIGFTKNDQMVTSNQTAPVSLWSMTAGNARIFPVNSRTSNYMPLALSADMSTLITRKGNLIVFTDIQTNTEKSSFRLMNSAPIIISNDGNQVCITNYNGITPSGSLTTSLYSINTGRMKSIWKSTETDNFAPNRFTHDLKYYLKIVKSSDNNPAKFHLFDTTSDIVIPTFQVPTFTHRIIFNNDNSEILLFSQKSNYVNDYELALWDVNEQKWRWKFSADKLNVNAGVMNTNNIPANNRLYYAESMITYTPDNKNILIELNRGESISAVDAKTGEILWQSNNTAKIRTITRDSRWVATSDAGTSPVMKVLDTRTGVQVALLQGNAKIICASFNTDGRWLAIGYADGSVILWDTKNWRKLCQLYIFSDGNWAVIDPLGRYDTSNGGDIDSLRWVIGDETIALRQLKDRYYEPALLAKVLGFNDEQLRPVENIAEVKLFPDMQVIPPIAGDTVLNIDLNNRGGGIGAVKVFVNGKEFIADARGAKSDSNVKNARYAVNLAESATLQRGRENLIEVISTNADGTLSSRSNALSFFAPGTAIQRQPEIYAIVVGISDYSSNNLKLRFAARDAEAMANALNLGAKRLFGTEKVHLIQLISGNQPDSRPTKANIQQAFKTIAARAYTDDILLIYLAGHGATLPGGNDTYCYLTSDAKNINDITDAVQRGKTAVTSDELRQWCTRIPALKQVMILDTCAAGAAAGTLIAKREISGDQIRAIERLKDRTGFHILMGCAANARSYETSRYGQGLLTYSLLQGMKGAALREGQFIDISTLFSYAADHVPTLAVGIGGLQRPVIATPKGNSFDIGQLTADDRGKIPGAVTKLLILRPALIDTNTIGDPLELTELLRKRIQNNDDNWICLDADTAPDGISLQGTYTINKEIVNMKIKIWKAEKELKTVSITEKKNNLSAIIDEIIKQLMLIKP